MHHGILKLTQSPHSIMTVADSSLPPCPVLGLPEVAQLMISSEMKAYVPMHRCELALQASERCPKETSPALSASPGSRLCHPPPWLKGCFLHVGSHAPHTDWI